MTDDETGSWWQQVSGEAIFGALKGQHLNPVLHDEVTFALWKKEHPQGRVLRPDDSTGWKSFSQDWEEHTARYPVFAQLQSDSTLGPRTQIVGIKLGGAAKAYPLAVIQKQSPIKDTLGDVPIIIAVAEDKKSLRAFESRIDGQPLEFFAKPESQPLRLVDAQTGSEWDFTGKALSGKYQGRELKKVYALKDYWFDWRIYNPGTQVYPGAGE